MEGVRILGIDPGSRYMGHAIVEKIGHNRLSRLADVKLQIPASGYEFRTGSTLTRILQIFVTDVLYSAVLGKMTEEEKAAVLRRWNFSVTHS